MKKIIIGHMVAWATLPVKDNDIMILKQTVKNLFIPGHTPGSIVVLM